MSEKKKVAIVNTITGSRFIGALLLPLIVTLCGPLGTAIYIGALWASDAVDGYLAKKRWRVSTIFGASLDAFCDKVLGIATLAYLYNFYPIMLFSLGAELAIFGTNWHYGKKGADVKSSKMGKFKTGILDISTVLAILSTISLTSSLSLIIPTIMGITSIIQIATLRDYVVKNKKYLKENKPINDVSKLGFVETVKEIIRLLKEPKIYSPKYFKEHNNQSLLDMLYEADKPEKKEKTKVVDEQKKETNNESILSIEEKNEFKINYNLTNKDLNKIEEYMVLNNISKEDMNRYLTLYTESIKTNYRDVKKLEEFIKKTIKK